MTGQDAMAIIFGTVEAAGVTALKELGKKDLPVFIKYLENCEKNKPGFLGIMKDIDMALVDVATLALGWCNLP